MVQDQVAQVATPVTAVCCPRQSWVNPWTKKKKKRETVGLKRNQFEGGGLFLFMAASPPSDASFVALLFLDPRVFSTSVFFSFSLSHAWNVGPRPRAVALLSQGHRLREPNQDRAAAPPALRQPRRRHGQRRQAHRRVRRRRPPCLLRPPALGRRRRPAAPGARRLPARHVPHALPGPPRATAPDHVLVPDLQPPRRPRLPQVPAGEARARPGPDRLGVRPRRPAQRGRLHPPRHRRPAPGHRPAPREPVFPHHQPGARRESTSPSDAPHFLF